MRTAPALAAVALSLAACGPGSPGGPGAARPGTAPSAGSRRPDGERADATVAYAVEGMHCNGCAEAIVAEVSEVKGVRAVRCTYESKVAVIELDADARPEAERAITKMGYKVRPVPVPPPSANAPGATPAPVPGVPAPAPDGPGQPADSK